MNAERLLVQYEQIADAPDAIDRLRRLIRDLAVRGKLVPQDAKDEPAVELLKRIAVERDELVKKKEIRREDPLDPIQSTEMPFDVPPRWVWSRIGEAVLFTQYGTSQKSNPSEKGVPVLTMGNVQDGLVIWSNEKRIPETSEDLPALYLRKFDLLYNRTNSAELVGKTGIYLGEDGVRTFASYLIRLRPSHKSTNPRFVNMAMNTPEFRKTQIIPLIKKQTGQANVNGTALKKMVIPLPPLAEQHRIVAKVDELMGLCDRLEAARGSQESTRDRLAAASLARLNAPDPETFQADARFVLGALPALTTRPDQIEQIRQTILGLAVRGKLVPQDSNDQPAAKLMRQIAAQKEGSAEGAKIEGAEFQQDPLEQFELPTSWQVIRLGDLLLSSFYGPRFGAYQYSAAGIPTIRTTDMTSDGRIVLRNPPRVIVPEDRLQGFRCLRGDLLVTRSGSIGTMAIFEADYVAIPSAYLIRFRFSPFILVRYIYLSLKSPDGQEALGLGTTRVAQPNINARSISAIPIRLPPLAEQHRIVAKVDALMALCDRLETNLTATAATRGRLLDALLAEALAPAADNQREAAE
ncbi:restriction endonuclease subunit S [Bradyrhizobium sp. AZCC 2289]|uniref:restriction endonuclease subunit S n=1 Tax=Bradyrhizobium sp. AZCC 2289 TaxID=3117026 RepID=UPI002FF171B6